MKRITLLLLAAALIISGSLYIAAQADEGPGTKAAGKTMQTEKGKAEKKAKADDSVAVIETKFGKIVLEFFPDVAPGHVANFKKLAESGFYNGTTFHRVIPGFMIQGGDPNSKDADLSNDGMGGPGYTINAEFNKRPHTRGALSMARTSDPNSAGSQFFICVADCHQLDGQYTVFGQVIKGMDVADKIVKLPRNGNDNPGKDATMTKVTIVPRSAVK